MVAEGTLDIRVVLPRGPDGSPLAASVSNDYSHVKSGVFTDPQGDQVGFSGSVNESEQAWVHNYEDFAVFRSWDPGPPHLQQIIRRFESLWRDEEPSWIVLDIPRAVRDRLIAYRPDHAPAFDPLEVAPVKQVSVPAASPFLAVPQKERLLFQYLRDAPYFPEASGLGSATSAIVPSARRRAPPADGESD